MNATICLAIDQEIFTPQDSRTEMNNALTLARSLPDDYIGEFINLQGIIAASPAFQAMLSEMITGNMLVREFAAYCYTAGRLSTALARHQ